MSTFRGVVEEFPDIRIDFFRKIEGVRPPLACFLSHVHSDHLAGLESLRAPFIYCSAATKELLVRLERYPHRINFAKGILESRKQHYKHLKNLLKPIPLETPTCIELSPGKEIQVTLFDANHCTGAVMFLIEDADNAILYTGDIRSEPWFVNRLARSPFLVEYSSGVKTLDCIYLDTSNAGCSYEFPTKAEGMKELIKKVSKYPRGTKFHFAAWTFGYEEVWMMLSRLLKSPIHVDDYKLRLYQSLWGDSPSNGGTESTRSALSPEAAVLAGYKCGNTDQPGILTHDQTVMLHSCEKGTSCSTIHDEPDMVRIQPIICREGSIEVAEVGIGGGEGDLTQKPELELDDTIIYYLIQLFENVERSVVDEVQRKLEKALRSSLMSVPLSYAGIVSEKDELSIDELTEVLVQSLTGKDQESSKQIEGDKPVASKILPKTITFPYSRHSSHSELCDLLKAFQPADVYPCTADEGSWHEGISIQALFGEFCSETHFRHDCEMRALKNSRSVGKEEKEDEDYDMVDTQVSRASLEAIGFENDAAELQSVQSLHTPLNSEQVATVTPGSDSQSLRRKAIEDLVQSPAKRLRSSDSSDGEDSIHSSEGTNEDSQFSTFYDGVHRCSNCLWEVWMPEGSCEGCEAGEDVYEEFIDPNEGVPFNLIHNLREVGADSELDDTVLAHLKESYLDCASSAYSDGDDAEPDEYEINSMIDDASINSEDSDHEEETDWKAKYEHLLGKYDILLQKFSQVDEGSLSDSGGMVDSEGYEAGDVRVVEVQNQDPQLVEIVLSTSQESDQMEVDMQMTSLSDEVAELRREASDFMKTFENFGT